MQTGDTRGAPRLIVRFPGLPKLYFLGFHLRRRYNLLVKGYIQSTGRADGHIAPICVRCSSTPPFVAKANAPPLSEMNVMAGSRICFFNADAFVAAFNFHSPEAVRLCLWCRNPKSLLLEAVDAKHGNEAARDEEAHPGYS